MLNSLIKKSAPVLLAFAFITVTAAATTLSDNLSKTPADVEIVSGDTWISSSFSTDSSSYTLLNATLLLDNSSGAAAQLSLYSNISGQPGSALGLLVSPSSFSSGIAEASFSGNGLGLAANTTYWLVLQAPGNGSMGWAWTNSNLGSGVGFQHTFGATDDAGASWFTTDLSPMIMSVTADPATSTPEPSTAALLICGFALTATGMAGWRNRRRKRAA